MNSEMTHADSAQIGHGYENHMPIYWRVIITLSVLTLGEFAISFSIDGAAQTAPTLFMLGVLDDEGVPPLSAEPADMQAAYDEMLAACQEAMDKLGWIGEAFADLQREIKTRSKTPDALDSEITTLRDDAGALVAAWCDPWVEQLERVEQMLAQPQTRLDAKLSREAASIRSELARQIAAGDDLEELRLRFSDLARETLASRDG